MSEDNQEIEVDEVLDEVKSGSSVKPNFKNVTEKDTKKETKTESLKPNFSKLSKTSKDSDNAKSPSFDFNQFQTTRIQNAKQKAADLGRSFNLSKGDANLNEFFSKVKKQREYTIAKAKSENQGFLGEFGGFLAQATAEIIGGTIEGAGYLLDVNSLLSGEFGEGNWFSDLGSSLKDWTHEVAPIYMDPDDEGKFAPWSSEWWFSNGVSVASALSIMIPVAGWTRGVSLIGKGLKGISTATKAAKATNKGAKINDIVRESSKYKKTFDSLMGKAGSTRFKNAVHQGVVSRHIESNMEAAGVYEEEYEKVLAETGDEQLAKNAASAAASMSYNLNSAMLLQDIPQYFLLGRSMKASRAFTSFKAAKAAGASTGKALMSSGYRQSLDMLSEAGEEAYQFIVGEESKHFGDVLAGIADDKDFSSRFGEYVTDGEFWTSAFFGGIGAGVMQSAKPIFDKISGKQDSRIKEIEERGTKRAYYNKKLREAAELTPDIYEQSVMNASVDMAITAAKEGNLQHYRDELESLKGADAETLEKMGVDEEFVKNIEKLQKDATVIEQIWDDNTGRFNANILPLITESKFIISKLDKQRADILRKIQNSKNDIPGVNELSADGSKVFEAQLEILAIKRTIEASKKILETKKDLTDEEKQEYEEFISKREEEVKEGEEAIKQVLADDTMLPLKDRKTLELIGDHKLKPNPIISETISNREKLKWQDALIDSHIKRLNKLNSDEITKAASKNKAAREENKKDFRRVQELFSLIHKGAKEETIAKKKTELDAFGKEVSEELQDEQFKHAVTDEDGFTRAYGSPLSIQEKVDAITEAEEILERTTDKTDRESIQEMINTMKDIVDNQKDRYSKQNKAKLLGIKIKEQEKFTEKLTKLWNDYSSDIEGFIKMKRIIKKELILANKQRTKLLNERTKLVPGSTDYDENILDWKIINGKISRLTEGLEYTGTLIEQLQINELYTTMNASNMIDHNYDNVNVNDLFIEDTDVLQVFFNGEKGILFKDEDTGEIVFLGNESDEIYSGGIGTDKTITIKDLGISIVRDSFYPLGINLNRGSKTPVFFTLGEHKFRHIGALPEESLNYDAGFNLESVTIVNTEGTRVKITNEVLKYEIADLFLTYQVSIIEPFQFSKETMDIEYQVKDKKTGELTGEIKLYSIDLNLSDITNSKVYVTNKNGLQSEILINQSHRNKDGSLNRKGEIIEQVYDELQKTLAEKVNNIEAEIINPNKKQPSLLGTKKTFTYNEKANKQDVSSESDKGPGPEEGPSQDGPTGEGTPPFEDEATLTGSGSGSGTSTTSSSASLTKIISEVTDNVIKKYKKFPSLKFDPTSKEALELIAEIKAKTSIEALTATSGPDAINRGGNIADTPRTTFIDTIINRIVKAAKEINSVHSTDDVPAWEDYTIDNIEYGTKEYTLPGGKVIRFNTQQEGALTKIENWLTTKETAFTLEGYAGTGKTTISKKIIDDIKNGFNENETLIVSAPTHRAKSVIQKATNEKAITLHQLLGLKPNFDIDNFDPKNLQFTSSGLTPPINNETLKLVVVDEASMINKALYKYLIEKAKANNVKILFMGDRAQLPPVGETLSEVFKNPNNAKLTWVQRTEGDNPLMGVFTKIRNRISEEESKSTKDGSLPYNPVTMINQNGEGITFLNNWNEKLTSIFSSDNFKNDSNFAKVIVWRNNRVDKWNDMIRKVVWPDAEDIVVVGETLTGYTGVETQAGKNEVENSRDYKIKEVKRIEKLKEDLNGKQISIKVLEVTHYDEELKQDKIIQILDHDDPNTLAWYKAKASNIFKEIYITPAGKQRNVMWSKLYYPFVQEYLLLKDIKLDKNQSINKHLGYPYASTTHKAQGATYENTFIDEVDIKFKNINYEERNKMLYTAMSRTSGNAYVLTDASNIKVAIPPNSTNSNNPDNKSNQSKDDVKRSNAAKNKIEGLLENKKFIKGLTKGVLFPTLVEVDSGIQFEKYVKINESGEIIAEFDRVSEFIKEKIPRDKDGNLPPLVQSAVTIGNKVDAIVRDFFKGTLQDHTKYEIGPKKEFDSLIKQLNELKEFFDRTNQIPVTDTIVLYDETTKLAGTVDLVTYDIKGEVRIYDVKTMKGNQFTDVHRSGENVGKEKYSYPYSKSSISNAEAHQNQLSTYRILMSRDANYSVTPNDVGYIIPIIVNYEEGDTKTSILKMPNREEILQGDLKFEKSAKGIFNETEPAVRIHKLKPRVKGVKGDFIQQFNGKKSNKKQIPPPSGKTGAPPKGYIATSAKIHSSPNNWFDTVSDRDGNHWLRFDKDENPVPKNNPGSTELKEDLIANPNLVKVGTEVKYTLDENDWWKNLIKSGNKNADEYYKHARILVSIKDENGIWQPIQVLEIPKIDDPTKNNKVINQIRKKIYDDILNDGESFGKIEKATQDLESEISVQIGPTNFRNVKDAEGNPILKPLAERFTSAYQNEEGTIKLVGKNDIVFELATTKGSPYGFGESSPVLDVDTFSQNVTNNSDIGDTKIDLGHGHVFAAILTPNGKYAALKLSTSNINASTTDKLIELLKEGKVDKVKEIIYTDYSNDEMARMSKSSLRNVIRINKNSETGDYYIEFHRKENEFYSINLKDLEKGGTFLNVKIRNKEGNLIWDKQTSYINNAFKLNPIELLKAAIKGKKYNIIKSKLPEEMQYQSPITGKIYKNYKDYLSGRNDINNNPNNEIKGAAILQTDVQPSAGNYYYASGMEFSHTAKKAKAKATKDSTSKKSTKTGSSDTPATVSRRTRVKKNTENKGLGPSGSSDTAASIKNKLDFFMRRWNMNDNGFTLGKPLPSEFKKEANALGLGMGKTINNQLYLVDPKTGKGLTGTNSPRRREKSLDLKKVKLVTEKYPYNTTRLNSGKLPVEIGITPKEWATYSDSERKYTINCY
jgi:hypothetical protein